MAMARKSLYFASAVLLIFLSAKASFAGSSVNVPVDSAAYDDLERLEVKGLLDSALLSTRPFGRIEAARLIREARIKESETSSARGGDGIILRLENRFRDALENPGASFLKPLDTVYVKAGYSTDENPFFININNNGDHFMKGGDLRTGLASSAGLFNVFSFYVNPEYRLDNGGERGTLLLGYMTIDLLGATLELGRDSMWWGPGYHGDLLLTDNARPFDMIKLTSQSPFLLPWIFRYIGLIKPTIFMTHIDKDMNYPRANILGMRLDFKPLPRLEIGLTRLFLNGGHGRKKLTLSDWWRLFLASNSAEHSDSPIDGNQMASVDASYVYVNDRKWIPFSGIRLYAEWGFIDSPGTTLVPTGLADLYGAFIDGPFWLKDADLRVEWANTAHNARYGPSWYTSGKYSTGWRYLGDIIGHHMGGDARDLFARAQYHYMEKTTLAVDGDWEKSGLHTGILSEKRWGGADVSYYVSFNTLLQMGAGYQDIRDPGSQARAGATVWGKATFEF